jgi:hypothetical protein
MKRKVIVEVDTEMSEEEFHDEIVSWLEDLTKNEVTVETVEEPVP